MEELGILLPALTRGWHLLQRAAFPEDKIPLVRTITKGKTDIDDVKAALLELFGPEALPDPKDIAATRRKVMPLGSEEHGYHAEDDYENELWYGDDYDYEEGYAADSLYEDECYDGDYWYDDDWYDYGYAAEDEDAHASEIPPELEKLWQETEDALVSYTQS